jgi:hypothetical protein
MKLIMENWREFINEQMAAGQEHVYPDMLKNLQELPDKIPPLTSTDIRHLISFFDPTQISAYPDIPPAIEKWKNNPSWLNTAMLVLVLLAVIPIIGKAAKGVSRFTKSLKSVKGGKNLAAKIETKVVKGASRAAKINVESMLLKSRNIIDNIELGKTTVLKDDLYLFVRAKEGKISSSYISPSKGMDRGKATKSEEILEKARKLHNPIAIPRKNSTYLTPYSDGGTWAHYGDSYVVMIPKGSKISKMDGHVATEVRAYTSGTSHHADPRRAAGHAEDYWKGLDAGVGKGSQEIITQAKVKVIGKAEDLKLSNDSIKKLSTPSYY